MKHTKNLLKCLFAAFCTTTLVFTASAFSPETVETAAEQTEARKETAALSAVVSTKPGLNILTGTTEPFGFEVETKDALSGLFAEGLANWELTADPVDGSKGKTLRQARAWSALTSTQFAGNTYEAERPFEWAVDALGANKPSANPALILYANTITEKSAIKVRPSFAAGSWQRLTGEVVISRDTSGYDPTYWAFFGNFKGLCIGLNTGSDRGEYDSSCYLYIDNYSIIPYYRVTYRGADGNVNSSAYFLRDSEGRVMTSFTPDYAPIFNIEGGKYRRCLGWSTEPNATEAQTSFALNNEDLVLYPVLGEEFEPLNSTANVLRAAANDKKETATITVSEGYTVADWQIDTGYSDALVTVSEDKRTVTVEPTGYAGVVTVKATMGGELVGTEIEKVIRLYGGTEYKPGLNLITGTTAAFDFENITQDDLNRAFADTNWTTGWTYTDDPLNNGGHAARQIGAWGFFQTTGLGDDRKDDVDRPFYWTTDVLATGNPDIFAIPGDYNGGHIGWFSGTAGKWHANAKEIVMSKLTTKPEGAWINKVRFRKIGTVLGNATGVMGDSAYYYVDNVKIIPGYKITYIAADSTETVVYVDGKSTEYTPDLTLLGSAAYTVEGSNEVYTTATAIPLAYKDIVIKAFIPEEPNTSDKNSIRVSAKGTGIRFAGFVSAAMHNAASEYGFLVTRADNGIDEATANEYLVLPEAFGDTESVNFSGTTDNEVGINFVGGRNYIKGGALNKTVLTDDGETPFGSYGKPGWYFTAVMVGLDKPYTSRGVTYATRYRVPIVARSYVKIGDTYYYGESKMASMKDVATRLLANENASEAEKKLAQDVLDKAELTME